MIHQLDETTINRICGSEVVGRPVNAVKELVENSLDASSRDISVQIENGGLSKIIVSDNGSGIPEENFCCVAQRYATTKLDTFSSLPSVRTFGFRGEALACLSYVAHVELSSRDRTSSWGHRASFVDGQLVGSISKVAMNHGTCVVISELNRHDKNRRAALNDPFHERKLIIHLLQSYALTFSGVLFSWTDISNGKSVSYSTRGVSNVKAPTMYGESEDVKRVAEKLLGSDLYSRLKFVEGSERDWKLRGLVSSLVAHTSPGSQSIARVPHNFSVMVNGRFLEWMKLRRSLQSLYKEMVTKDSTTWIHMSVEIPTAHVDPNADPTKTLFVSLNEDELIEWIRELTRKTLVSSHQTRRQIVAKRPVKDVAVVPSSSQSSAVTPVVDIAKPMFNKLQLVGGVQFGLSVCEYCSTLFIVDWKQLFVECLTKIILEGRKTPPWIQAWELEPMVRVNQMLESAGLTPAPVHDHACEHLRNVADKLEFMSIDLNSDIVVSRLGGVLAKPNVGIWIIAFSRMVLSTDSSCCVKLIVSAIAESETHCDTDDSQQNNDETTNAKFSRHIRYWEIMRELVRSKICSFEHEWCDSTCEPPTSDINDVVKVKICRISNLQRLLKAFERC